jgi:hypothetical protein
LITFGYARGNVDYDVYGNGMAKSVKLRLHSGVVLHRHALGTHLEYPLIVPWRFGLVASGGAGATIPGGSQLLRRVQAGHFLPSGGGGLRFELSKKYHVNLRADIAQGRDGHTFGMGVGEAF